MTRILVLEGNTPDICAARTARGVPWAAEAYGAALARFRPGLETVVARPYFDGYDPAALPLDAVDGVAITGSGVSWSAADARARPFVAAFEAAVDAGLPVIGCCWGLQVGAVALGGRVGAGPNGVEAAVARNLTLTEAGRDHPLHAGRPARFDALCFHRDDVLEPPPGAVVTAANDHTGVQGMAHEGARFWGLQYHPEISLTEVAFYLHCRTGSVGDPDPGHEARVAAFDRMAADPEGEAELRAAFGIGAALVDPELHGAELGNWLRVAVGGAVPEAA